MNLKIKKGLRLAAAAIFVFALALNIKITLDDPFLMMSDEAVASTTYSSGGGGGSSGGGSSGGGCEPQILGPTVERFVRTSPWSSCGQTHPAGIYFSKHTVKDCWAGGTVLDCEGGSLYETSNVAGQVVCTVNNCVPIICL